MLCPNRQKFIYVSHQQYIEFNLPIAKFLLRRKNALLCFSSNLHELRSIKYIITYSKQIDIVMFYFTPASKIKIV